MNKVTMTILTSTNLVVGLYFLHLIIILGGGVERRGCTPSVGARAGSGL